MTAKRIVIVTPAPPRSRSGNRNTATRWARILRDLGYRATIRMEWHGEPCDVIVVLHARHGHASLKAFRDAHPDVPAILALTGTDIYRDIRSFEDAQRSLEMASRLIVLQKAALDELTPSQRSLACVIHQSEVAHYAHQPPRRVFRALTLGHLREEKDPFRGALALHHLPRRLGIELVQAGKALDPKFEHEAKQLMRQEPRYRWIGEISHARALKLLATGHVMVISSYMEGGAHVVSEAIVHGVPVIASDIPGNRGMLGEDYPGYYPAGDDAALASLLLRAYSDPEFLAMLKIKILARQPLFHPQRESEAWHHLLDEVFRAE